jgi:hypothetical protein
MERAGGGETTFQVVLSPTLGRADRFGDIDLSTWVIAPTPILASLAPFGKYLKLSSQRQEQGFDGAE